MPTFDFLIFGVKKIAYISFFWFFFHPTGVGVPFQPPHVAHNVISRTKQARVRAKNGGKSDEGEESRRQRCRTRGDRPGKQRDPEGELMATSHHSISCRRLKLGLQYTRECSQYTLRSCRTTTQRLRTVLRVPSASVRRHFARVELCSIFRSVYAQTCDFAMHCHPGGS